MSKEKILVIGLGNLLMGDDGVGIHIIRELKKRPASENIDLIDGGTAGIGLIDLFSTYETVIVIDALMYQGAGQQRIRLFSPDDILCRDDESDYSVHDVELASTLRLMKTLEMDIPVIRMIGIPAVSITPKIGISEECSRFIPEAVDLITAMMREVELT